MSSHAVKYWVEHKSDVDGNERTYRIELLEEGFGGSSTEKQGYADTGVFRLNFERLSRDQIFEGIAQKGRLELDLAIQNASDLAILTDIVAGDENKYKLRLKVDGSVKWTGFVIPDLIQYPEGDYPHPGTITAKDLSLIESEDFETNTAISYELYMSVIADLVNSTGLGLNVHSYNDWTTGEISDSDDYFNQAYIDKYHLQNFSSFNEGNFEARNKLDVLKEIIPPGFILRQYDNVWNLFSVDYLAKSGGTVKRYEYNTSGTKTGSTSSIDLTEDVDRVDNYIEGTSQNKPWRGLKQLRVEFNHKTSIQNILFDDEYVVSADSANEYGKETLKVSDTTQRRIKLSGQVEVTTDTNPGSTRLGEVYLIIQVGDYEIDLSDGSWDQNHGEETVSVSGSDTTLTGTFSEPLSDNIPNVIGEDTLTIELRWGSVTGETVQQVRWHNLSLSLINGEDIDDGASKFYRLTQSGTYSSKKDITPIIFGQGPTDLSNSTLRYFSGSAVFEMLTGFRHVGDGSGDQYEEFVLTNLMNLQRGVISSLNADLRALYNPRNLLVHNSKNYLFLDGQLSGKDSLWNGTIVELNWQTGSDTFSEFFKIGDGDAGNTIAVSSGTGGSTGDFDDRYFKQSNNLSEGDPATIRSNIGTVIGTDVQAWDAQLDTLSTLTATQAGYLTSLDQGVSTTDAVTFATVNTGQGNNELYTMDQDVQTSDAVTFATVNTGQGDNELYAMDQDVRTTDGVTFNGATLTAALTGTSATFSSNVEVNGILNIDGNVALDDASTDISTDTFLAGFAGEGLAFENEGSNKWKGEFNNLTIRERLRVYELLINQIRASNGSVVVSSASKPESIATEGSTASWSDSDVFWSDTDTYWHRTYKVVIEENKFVPFELNDLVRAQRFTGNGTYLTKGTVVGIENGDPDVTVNTTTRYFLMNITEDSDVPTAGMDFVRFGNLDDADRQGLLYLTSDEDDSPYMDVQYGLDSHDAFGGMDALKGRIGRLDGITDTDFPTLDGTQTNEFGVYINGGYFNNVEVRGTITILDSDSSNAATKSYVDNATAASGSQIIRSNTEPTTRTDGSSLLEGDLWIETDNGDKPRTYNGSSFVEAYTIIDGGNLSTGSVTAAKIAANTITASEIAADTITASQIASGTITASEISAGTITATELASNSVTASKINVTDLSAVNASTGALTVSDTLSMGSGGKIIGSNGRHRLDESSLTFFEDNLTTARVTLDGTGATLPTSATVRDSISGANTSPTAELTIVDYDRIKGSWVPEETAGDNLTTFDYSVIYEGWNGSSWSEIDRYEDSLAGSSTGVTQNFSIQDESGYSKFRIRITDRNSSGGTWQFDTYNAQQNKSEVVMNPRGTSIVGGLFYLVDLPNNSSNFDLGSIPTNAVYSDEKDSNGNWILKIKA